MTDRTIPEGTPVSEAIRGLSDTMGAIRLNLESLGQSFVGLGESYRRALIESAFNTVQMESTRLSPMEVTARPTNPTLHYNGYPFRGYEHVNVPCTRIYPESRGTYVHTWTSRNYSPLTNTDDIGIIQGQGDQMTATPTERTPEMPRRRNRQQCECGCGQMTETGRFLRGHATRRRWDLIRGLETGERVRPVGEILSTMTVHGIRSEMADRGWMIPTTRRTFGVEFELVSPRSQDDLVRELTTRGFSIVSGGRFDSTPNPGEWVAKRDGSIRSELPNTYGIELVSPPLRGKRGEQELTRILAAVNDLGCTVNATCGTHVHLGVSDLSLDGLKRTVKGYHAAQHAISTVMAASRRDNQYCKQWEARELTALERAGTIESLNTVADRYRTVNLRPYARIGTVEFRQHHATLNSGKILAWVKVLRQLVDRAGRGKIGDTTDTLTMPRFLYELNLSPDHKFGTRYAKAA